MTLTRVGSAILAGLLALQAGIPSLGLDEPVSNFVALAVSVGVAVVAVLVPSPIKTA